MSDQKSDRVPGPARKFVPDVKSLESRCLLTTTIPHTDGIVWDPNPPRTGGLADQNGSVLHCFVGEPKRNAVQVSVDGLGDVEMSWNMGATHAFAGITKIVIQAERARTDQFTFQLTGDTSSPVPAVAEAAGTTVDQSGPSTGPTAIDLRPHQATDSASANAAGHPVDHLRMEHGGVTIETDPELKFAPKGPEDGFSKLVGPELTVIANRPATNVVQITNDPASNNVHVDYNGRGYSYPDIGVQTIVVNTRNATKDEVVLTDLSA